MGNSNPLSDKEKVINSPIKGVSIEVEVNLSFEDGKDRVTSSSQQAKETWDNKEKNIDDIENALLFDTNSNKTEGHQFHNDMSEMVHGQVQKQLPVDKEATLVSHRLYKFWQTLAHTISSPFTLDNNQKGKEKVDKPLIEVV